MLLSQFVPPSPSLLCPQVCFLCLDIYCCPAYRFISTSCFCFLDSMYMILVFPFLTYSLCITGSRFIYLTGTDSDLFLFMAQQYSIVYMYHNLFMHSSVDKRLGCFHVLAIVKCCNEHWGTYVFQNGSFLSVYAQQWDYWVMWQLSSQFFKKSPYRSPRGQISLHSQEWYKRVPSPHPLQHLLVVGFLFFFIMAILTSVR